MTKNYFLTVSACFILFSSITAQSGFINTVAGNNTLGFSGDGANALVAQLNGPTNVAIDGAGNLFIADWSNSRIRKVNTSGIISTVAGSASSGYSGDGTLATTAKLNHPEGIAVDAMGNLYIADEYNHVIRMVNTSGIISTIAGTNVSGYSGDGLSATLAKLNFPTSVIVDASGNLYIADHSNNTIRKINTSGIISTIAGNGTAGYSGDGSLATAAKLNQPWGLATDASGNIYIADFGNNVIRKVNSSGVISTFAGTGTLGYSGDGGASNLAKLHGPSGVVADALGNVYIADDGNNSIRLVNPSGTISTLAGNGTAGYTGNGGIASSAKLDYPFGVALDAANNLFLADYNNNVIRKINSIAVNGIIENKLSDSFIKIYPNPTSDQIFIEATTTDKLTVDLYDINGRHVFSINVSDKSIIDVTNLNEGVYGLTIKTADRVINKKLVIVR